MKPVEKIKNIERRMVDIYQNHSGRGKSFQAAERIDKLKLERWRLLRESFEWTDENVRRIEQMNELMKESLLDMRRRTIEVYESLKGWCTPDMNLYVNGTLWVEEMAFEGWEEDEDMEAMLFDIMMRKPFCGFYANSVSMSYDLLAVLQAMKDNHVMSMTYQDYYDEEPREIMLEPYCVRVFRQRWYVIGVMENEPDGEEPTELANQGHIRRYALDRVQHLEVANQTFKMPRHFSVDSYFADAFGIIVEPEEYDVENIRLKVYDINHRREYLRSLPLHHSQREIEKHSEYSIFELRLMPTYDLIKELLSMGGEVEVISPAYVREEIKRRIQELSNRYL